MSKRPAKKPAPKPPEGKTAKEDVTPAPAPLPLKPRPRLFWILLVIFLIWLGGLLALYFAKVYPMRYPSSAPVAGAKP